MTAPAGILQLPDNSGSRSRQVQGMVGHDQFGRAWDLEIDLNIDTMTWVGPPLLKDCRPPVDIPQNFVKPVVENRRIVLGRVYCDFAAWRTEQLTLGRYWRQALLDRAKQMYPNSYGEAVKNPPRDLLIEAGPAPMPHEIIEACAAGNKWALGIRKPDGTFYHRPNWVTDDMLDRIAALKNVTGWREDGSIEDMQTTIADYPDFEDEEEHFDPEALGGKTIAIKRGPGRPRKNPIE